MINGESAEKDPKLQAIAGDIRAGRLGAAREALETYLNAREVNPAAWYLHSQMTDDAREKAARLQTALRADPTYERARKALSEIEGSLPAEVRDSPRPARRAGRYALALLLVFMLVVIGVMAGLMLLRRDDPNEAGRRVMQEVCRNANERPQACITLIAEIERTPGAFSRLGTCDGVATREFGDCTLRALSLDVPLTQMAQTFIAATNPALLAKTPTPISSPLPTLRPDNP